jgi:hypothetical protein
MMAVKAIKSARNLMPSAYLHKEIGLGGLCNRAKKRIDVNNSGANFGTSSGAGINIWDCRKVNIFIISKKQFISSFFTCFALHLTSAFWLCKIPSPFLARLPGPERQYCLLLSNTI